MEGLGAHCKNLMKYEFGHFWKSLSKHSGVRGGAVV
jgi:hypothetical protein